jgi:hypothetical protein
MTTAHRPTWNNALASSSRSAAPSYQYSSRDMTSHTKLKERQSGQNTRDEVKRRDLKSELEERESRTSSSKRRREGDSGLFSFVFFCFLLFLKCTHLILFVNFLLKILAGVTSVLNTKKNVPILLLIFFISAPSSNSNLIPFPQLKRRASWK